MSKEAKFPKGFYHNQNDKSPDFVIANVGIQRDRFIEWLKTQDENVSIDLLMSREGKPYAKVNDFKPKGGNGKISEDSGNSGPELDSNFDDMDDDLPFAWLLLPFGFTLMQIIGL